MAALTRVSQARSECSQSCESGLGTRALTPRGDPRHSRVAPAMLEQHEPRLPSPRELKAQIDAERTGQSFVFWRDGAGAQHIMMLSADRPRVTIGRREQSDIALTWDQEVSR